ncbi:hypothetical protein [uncultured Mobiluncus sp.]|uniref:hypothetical protein n=1 Tax=uncultured Mobiluncus sp. TaxID=293425 RepID=UPI00288910EB|nr:hypothetical protein [uncultured Mobiluncus sp.]
MHEMFTKCSTATTYANLVLEAALEAWRLNGKGVVVDSSIPGNGIFAKLIHPDDKSIEYCVEEDVDESTWETLLSYTKPKFWTQRALVPLQSLGQAHDFLREGNFEIQGWWIGDEDNVLFGSVEVA